MVSVLTYTIIKVELVVGNISVLTMNVNPTDEVIPVCFTSHILELQAVISKAYIWFFPFSQLRPIDSYE